MKQLSFHKRGMSLVEVVIAAFVITVFISALVGLYNTHLRVIFGSIHEVKAGFLGEEGQEAVKYLRNLSWNTNIAPLSTGAVYYLAWQNGKWELSSSPSYVDGLFERTVILGEVERDAQSNIVSTGGVVDPNAREVTITVAWQEKSATTTKTLKTYITNLFDN